MRGSFRSKFFVFTCVYYYDTITVYGLIAQLVLNGIMEVGYGI